MSDLGIQATVEMSTEDAERALGRVGDKAGRMAVDMVQAGQKASQAVKQIGDVASESGEKFSRAEGSIVSNLKRLAVEAAKGKSVIEGIGNVEFNIAAKGLDASKFKPMLDIVRQLQGEYRGLAVEQGRVGAAGTAIGAGAQKMGGGLQNLSYQLQDVIVQVNGGTDAMRALSMQLPQMLIGFGAAGAVIGVVAALLPNLIAGFSGSAAGAKTFADAMSDYDKAIGNVGETTKQFDLDPLYEQFNKSSDAVRAAIIEQVRFQQEYIRTTQLVAQKKFGESLGGLGEYSTLNKLAGAWGNSPAEELAGQLGLSAEVARDFMPVLRGLQNHTEDIGLAFDKFGTKLLGGNQKAVEMAATLSALAKTEREAAAASSALSTAQSEMTKRHITTKDEAKKSAKAVQAEAEELAKLMAKLNASDVGVEADYVKNVELLIGAWGKGKLTLDELHASLAKYASQQKFMVDADREAAESEKARQKAREQAAQAAQKEAQSLAEQVARAREENEQIGLTVEQLDALKLARIDATIATKEQALATMESGTASAAEVQAILRQIDALNELRSITASSQVKTANKKAADDTAKAWENFGRDIEQSLTDALFRGLEKGGKGGAKVARDTIINSLKAIPIKLSVQAIVNPVMNGVQSLMGVGNAAAGTAGSLFSAGSGMMNGVSAVNSLSMASGVGTAGSGLYGAFATSSVGQTLGLSQVVPGLMGPTTTGAALGSATAGGATLSSLGAAVPYVAIALAVASMLADNEPDTVRGKLAVRTDAGGFEDNAQLKSRYGYVGFNDGDTENFSGKAAQAASKGLIDTLDLLTAAFGGTDATAQKLATSIQGIDFGKLDGTYTTEDWLKNYTGNIGKGLVTALRDADLEGQVGQAFASLTDAAIAGLTDEQTTSLIGATTSGIMGTVLDVVDEAAVGVEGVVAAIDKVTAALPTMTQQLGLTADNMAGYLQSAVSNADGKGIGKSFVDNIIGGIQASMYNGVQQQISSMVSSQIITPILTKLALGDSLETILEGMDLSTFTSNLDNVVDGFNDFVDSPVWQRIADKLNVALNPIDKLPGSGSGGGNSSGDVPGVEFHPSAPVSTFTPYDMSSWRTRADVLQGVKTERQSSLDADVLSAVIGGASAADQALIKLVYALEDAAAAADLKGGWQDKLDVLQGTKTERQISLTQDLASTTDAATQAIIKQVYSLEDMADVANEAAGLQTRLWELEGNTTAIRAQELAKLDPSNQALQQRIWLLEDEQNTIQANLKNVDTARNALMAGYEKEVSALEQTRDKFDGFAKSLKSFRDGLLVGNLSTLSPEQKYFELQGRFTDISRRAQLGDVAAIESLQQVSQEFLDASQGYYASSPQYALDFQAVLAATEGTESLATRQAKIAQEQLDTWRGYGVQFGLIEEHTKTLTELFQAWVAASNTAGQAIPGLTQQSIIGPGVVPVSTPSDSMMGVFRDNYLSGFVSDAMAGGDAAIAAAAAAKANGFTADQIAAKWNDMTGEQVSATDLTAWAKENKIPGYAVGANYITRDQLALVHRGEQIKPAAYVEQDRKERNETNALLRQLLAELQADKAQRGAIGTETIAKLEALVDTGAAQKRELARAA
jgi:hypothetical protein